MTDPVDSDDIRDGVEPADSPKARMTILEHLGELRNRIIISIISLVAAFFIAFYFREQIFIIALKPYGPDFRPIVLDVTERFLNYFKVAMAASIIIASPVIVGQLVAFIAPGLLAREKRILYPIIPIIVLLFIMGAAFGYFLVLPVALRFLLNFGSGDIVNQIRLDRSINFVVNTCLACGIAFQLPVVVFVLSKVGIVTESFMRKQRKMAIVVIMVLAAALTPTPDPFTMLLVAAPMLLLYEVSIFVARFSSKRVQQIDSDDVISTVDTD
ncbi:MAG: twin-arginine translocase subunit TatC [bacterium]